MGWFFQTRLEARFNFVVAAVLTALPFAGGHVPLLLLDDHVSARSVLVGIAGLLILGIVVRLLMGVMLRAALDSVLAVGVLHQIFDASNNNGGVVDSLLDGVDAGNMTQVRRGHTDDLDQPRGCSGDVLAHSPNAIYRVQIALARWVTVADAVMADVAGRLTGLLRLSRGAQGLIRSCIE